MDTVFFWVSDLDRSVEWYRHVLGIEAGPRFGDWQIMVGEGPTFALHQGGGPHQAVNAVVAFAVADLDNCLKEVERSGISPLGAVTDTGVSRFATLADPDGNQVQLIQKTV